MTVQFCIVVKVSRSPLRMSSFVSSTPLSLTWDEESIYETEIERERTDEKEVGSYYIAKMWPHFE